MSANLSAAWEEGAELPAPALKALGAVGREAVSALARNYSSESHRRAHPAGTTLGLSRKESASGPELF